MAREGGAGGDTPLKLALHVVHASKALTPLKRPLVHSGSEPALKDWALLLELLSYQEGVIDGLGANATSREWAGLLSIATLPTDDLSHLSPEWCEAALIGALRSLPAWPHIFKAYKRPMKPLDGRLILPIALERYLLLHPKGRAQR